MKPIDVHKPITPPIGGDRPDFINVVATITHIDLILAYELTVNDVIVAAKNPAFPVKVNADAAHKLSLGMLATVSLENLVYVTATLNGEPLDVAGLIKRRQTSADPTRMDLSIITGERAPTWH